MFGGGKCSLCGSNGTTSANCPLNENAKKPSFEKHPNALSILQQYELIDYEIPSSSIPVPPPRKIIPFPPPGNAPPIPPPRKSIVKLKQQIKEQRRQEKERQQREERKQKEQQKDQQRQKERQKEQQQQQSIVTPKPRVTLKSALEQDSIVTPGPGLMPKPKISLRSKDPVKIVESTKESVSKCMKKDIVFDSLLFAKQFRDDGVRYLKTFTKKELKNIVCIANDAYYNESPFLTDDEYDVLREYVEKHDKTADFGIGSKVTRNKVALPYFMGSMNKIKPDSNAIEKWKLKYTGPYVISTKMDGISGLFVMQNGIQKLYTRGDGTIGQDISYLIPHLSLPSLQEGMAVRGEFIIKKSVYESKYNNNGPARNYVAGLMNRVTVVDSDYKDVDFVAYELINPVMVPSEQMKVLESISNNVVKNVFVSNVTNESLSSLLLEWRKSYDYDIDGIVVVCDHLYQRKKGNPDHAFAFKMLMSDQIVEAKVIDVEWSASKHGLLKPRVRIEEVIIGGVKINYATGFNAKFIVENSVGLGAIVKLVRSGDVIPHIMEVVKPATSPIMPMVSYHWTETGVDIVLDALQQDETVNQKRIVDFFKKMNVSGAGPGVVSKLYNNGFDNITKVINMNQEDFAKVFGASSKTGLNIYNGLQNALMTATLAQLINASNILDKGFGLTRLNDIFDAYPNLLKESKENIKFNLLKIEGISTKLADSFVEKVTKLKDFISNIETKINIIQKQEDYKEKEETNAVKPLSGLTLVFTGKRNKDLENLLIKNGAKISNTVNRNTSFVISDSEDSISNKIKKANQLGIRVLTTSLVANNINILLQ